jgi:SAM-dependent methyltransferase
MDRVTAESLSRWLKENRADIVETLKGESDDTQVRGTGLELITILRDVFFARGPRDWFKHDLEFFRLAEKEGVHLLPKHFYSTVPASAEIPESHWERYRTPGIDWREAEQWRLVEKDFAPLFDEFARAVRENVELGNLIKIAPFSRGDLALYYATLRQAKPKRIIEVGSGASTRVALEAIARNEGGELVCVEPYPSTYLKGLAGPLRIHQERVQSLGPEFFAGLEDNDVLFIDSTHVAVVGSDVNHLILQILPTLKPGVLVHFHDIALPNETPRSWLVHDALFWNEQHLLQAFLAFNRDFMIRVSSAYLEAAEKTRYTTAVGTTPGGGSIWIRRVDGTSRAIAPTPEPAAPKGPAPIVEEEPTVPAAQIERIEHELHMPKYLFHQPMDGGTESHAPEYPAPVIVPGEPFPLPPAVCRPGYAPDDDALYLKWGKSDHDVIMSLIRKHHGVERDMTILDFGCSSGRVLRQFYKEQQELGWKLKGTDIQAYLVEWMRRYFPDDIEVMCGSTYPHLPFKDGSVDVIFGISVFTHTKYLWDMWLAEFTRVLKPGGLVMQSVQCEAAWRFYHEHRNEGWVKAGHPASMLEKPELDEDFFLFGDGLVSQTFFKEAVIKKYWGRYLDIVDFLPPPAYSYQNWIVGRAR